MIWLNLFSTFLLFISLLVIVLCDNLIVKEPGRHHKGTIIIDDEDDKVIVEEAPKCESGEDDHDYHSEPVKYLFFPISNHMSNSISHGMSHGLSQHQASPSYQNYVYTGYPIQHQQHQQYLYPSPNFAFYSHPVSHAYQNHHYPNHHSAHHHTYQHPLSSLHPQQYHISPYQYSWNRGSPWNDDQRKQWISPDSSYLSTPDPSSKDLSSSSTSSSSSSSPSPKEAESSNDLATSASDAHPASLYPTWGSWYYNNFY